MNPNSSCVSRTVLGARTWHFPGRALFALASLLAALPAQTPQSGDTYSRRSDLLTAFWGREMFVRAAVALPADRKADEHLPVCYSIHGFGGSAQSCAMAASRAKAAMAQGGTRMCYVYLHAQFSLGHHEFADSVNNGPWGKALTTEFAPALEAEFHVGGDANARFLTGHSSGGWSSLWLQVTYPDFFGGTWSTAPDSVDFRDFTGIDVYRFANAYADPDGKPIQLVRRKGEWVQTIQEFVEKELAKSDHGGQFMSFNAVFSPRGEDARPMPLFDAKTGVIDRAVAEAWKRYDIGLVLRENWATLGPKLKGKLRVFVGTQDTYRLEGACRLLAQDLEQLGSDAKVVFAEGRDHGTLLQPHAQLWPDGLQKRIHGEMRARYDATHARALDAAK
jgi:hypothetical protein